MKIALVHDDLIQHGGAERVFVALAERFSQADIFTSMVSKSWKLEIRNWKLAEEKSPNSPKSDSKTASLPNCPTAELTTSFMQRFPFKKQLYRYYFPLYSLAFESFDFSNYDAVLSSSTRFAHGIITKPETTHICYMHSPGRMWWEPQGYFSGGTGPGSTAVETRLIASLRLGTISPFLSWLRAWDYAAAQRVDYFIANSKSVQAKIKKYYNREAEVIYPFVDLERFPGNISSLRHSDPAPEGAGGRISERFFAGAQDDKGGIQNDGNYGTSYQLPVTDYYLVVSRLTPWKRIDMVIEACNQLQLPLVVIGEGPDRKRLQKLAGPRVEFRGRLSGEDVVQCYQSAKVLVFPQREDFGITPLEAMACGKPVLAYKAGGALETVLPGETGEFFYPQTVEALAKALSSFKPEWYDPAACRKQAERFGRERFEKSIQQFVSGVVNTGQAC